MKSNIRFQKIIEPGQIGNMQVRNRMVMGPMASPIIAGDDGSVTTKVKDYFEARARGGAGLIIIGYATIDFPISVCAKPRLSVDDDKFLPGLTELMQVIHRHGAKAAVQLNHPGPSIVQSLAHTEPVAASAVVRPADYHVAFYWTPRELTVPEIAAITDQFARAARRAQKAGFDAVEIHAGHRYLLNSFLSPFYNQRKDQYGGSLENRARFLFEVLRAVRKAVGEGYPVWCRINGIDRELKEKGTTVEDAASLGRLMAGEPGLVNAINVSCNPPLSPSDLPGHNLEVAAAVRNASHLPVLVAGRISPEIGEAALAAGKTDYVIFGRSVIADPELPNKVTQGRLDLVRPCLYCDTCRKAAPLETVKPGDVEVFECTINPAATREADYVIRPATNPRRVLIAGGGPAGMEAARVAALRGHQVTLYERDNRLGGSLVLASVMRRENEPLIGYLVTQMQELGVKVELGKELTPELVSRINPDVVIVAEGATSAMPDIPGGTSDKILSSRDIEEMRHGHVRIPGSKGATSLRRLAWCTGFSLMKFSFGPPLIRWGLNTLAPFGKKVVVIGKGLHGFEMAYFLAERGKEVTIVDTRGKAPFDEPPMPVLRRYFEGKLAKKATILTAARYEAVTDQGLTIIDKDGKRQDIQADTIIFATDYKPKTKLSRQLAGKSFRLRLIGDCAKPCGILDALRDGYQAGMEI